MATALANIVFKKVFISDSRSVKPVFRNKEQKIPALYQD